MRGTRKRPPVHERFWSNVECGAPDICWPWCGTFFKLARGQSVPYGRFVPRAAPMRNGKQGGFTVLAHRMAYELYYGGIASPVVRHTCDNPACCNPAHLLAGTHADNVRDRVERNRSPKKTHCVHGHPFSGGNVAVLPNGKRRCRTCNRLQYYRRKAAVT